MKRKEIVAFRLERFYTIYYKSILGFKGLKMWRKMYHEGKANFLLEYKENLSSNTFLKTISAYANYGEGKIMLDNDPENVIGITDPVNGCLNLENKMQ